MKGDLVPNRDHIARLCGGSHVNEDDSISGTAFRLREISGQTEEYLSVNWLEFLKKKNRAEEIAKIQEILAAKLPRGIGTRARIAVLNVGEMCGRVRKDSVDKRNLRVSHEPQTDDPCHGGIFNLKLEDEIIVDMIAQTIKEIHPAKRT